MIDAFHSLEHYGQHIAPVFAALPAHVRGGWWTPANLPRSERLTIVASYRDAQTIGRPYVLVEHGAGQTYSQHERNGSYPGGEGHERCALFLCPSERVAGLWRERYPDTPAVVVGCPRLDALSEKVRGETGSAWHKTGDSPLQPANDVPPAALIGYGTKPGTIGRVGPQLGVGRSDVRGSVAEDAARELPTVAVTFHADLAVCPETRSAWRYYDPHLPRLVVDPRFRVVGHGHPRLWPTIRHRWAELGVEQWPDVDRVLSEADLLVADNTSVLYEACALGIPTVCLNLPSYRRDVESGGRFWSHPPGVQVDHPSELADAIACALTDPPAHRAIRARAVEWAYGGPITSDASERAAAAIMEVLNVRA